MSGWAQREAERQEHEAKSMDDEMAALRERVAELEAIIAGRATPPTDAEIEAHCARGGKWRNNRIDRMDKQMALGFARGHREGRIARYVIGGRMPSRWWALDAEDRPCAWPVVDSIETKEK